MLRLPLHEFETIRTLGTGAGGDVRAVLHRPSGRRFALKPGAGVAARRELSLLARFRHPNVVALEGLAESPDAPPGLLLEWMEGGSLANAGPGLDVVRFASDALRGLAFLHARGFVHGDLKPSNFLRSGDGRFAVADLGFARAVTGVEEGGTPTYMPPERLAGAPATPAGDLYSLAATLVELLGGPAGLQAGLSHARRAAWLERASTPLAPWLRGLHAADPSQRPSTVRGAARLLRETLNDDSVAREVPASERAWLHPDRLVQRDGVLDRLSESLRKPGVTLLRAAPGAGGTRLLEELSIRDDAVPVAARDVRFDVASTGRWLVDAPDDLPADALVRLEHVLRRASVGEPAPSVVVLVRVGGAVESRLVTEGAGLVELPPLDVPGVASLLAQVYPDRGETGPFAKALVARVGGAPGPLLSTLTRLFEAGLALPGVLVDGDVPLPDVLDALPKVADDVPSRALLQALSAVAESRVLALLAVARRPVSRTELRELSGRTELELDATLRRFAEEGWLTTGTRVALDGEQLRARIQANLARSTLAVAHRAFAVLLGGVTADDDASLLARADRLHHQLALDDAPVADDVVAVVSGLSKRSWAGEVVALVEAIVSSGQAVPGAVAAERARALAQLGRLPEALAEARRLSSSGVPEATGLAAELALKSGDYAGAARDLEAARALPTFDPAHAALLARALVLAGKHDESLQIVNAYQGKVPPGPAVDLTSHSALAWFYKGDLDRAARTYAEAAEAARALGDRTREANAVNGLGLVAHRRGAYDDARGHYERALALGEEAGDRARVGTSWLNLGTVLQELSRSREAAQAYRRSATTAQVIGERVQSARARSNLANLLLSVGRLDDALAAAEEARVRAKAAGAGVVEAYAELVLGEGALVQERLEDARKWLSAARDRFSSMHNASECCEAKVLLARVTLLSGKADDAAAEARAAASEARSANLDGVESQALLVLAESLLARPGSVKAARGAGLRALGLALPAGRPDWTWRIEAVLSRAFDASDESLPADPAAAAHHASRALVQLDLAAAAVDDEDRGPFLSRPDRARLRGFVAERGRRTATRADERLSRLLAINRRLGGERNVKELLEEITDQAIELCGAERGFVLLAASEEDGGGFLVRVARNIDGESITRGGLSVSHGIAERVLSGGEPELTLDAMSDERYRDQLSVAALKLRSVLCVPLRFQGKILGALYIDNRFRARAFGPDDLSLLEAFADQAAIALAQVSALEATEKARAEADRARKEIEVLNARLSERVETQEVELEKTRREADEQRLVVERQGRFSGLVAGSPQMQRLVKQVERIAATDLTVLVTGESGTGKEVIAKALFANGPRRAKPFVGVNCGALNDNLLESELFGHVKGAFTGADRDRDGLFQVADGGTLFLDEVGDTSLAMQVKLLRALQEGEIRKVGGKSATRVDVRVIAATNRDLDRMMKEGKFREDLYYRLNVVMLHLPPLRERGEDLPELCRRLLSELPGRDGKALRLTQEALALLGRYHWPGNIRELRATLHNAAVFADSEVLQPQDFAHKPELKGGAVRTLSPGSPAVIAGRNMDDLEMEAILRTLDMTKGNKSETARLLGIDRKTLYNKLGKLKKA